jgi:putative endonuclease
MTNKYNTVLYTGITNNLIRRVYDHREKLIKGFTKRYNVDKLVYYEVLEDITEAISREKQIKGGSREKKIELIDGLNEEWKDLYGEICGQFLAYKPKCHLYVNYELVYPDQVNQLGQSRLPVIWSNETVSQLSRFAPSFH